MASYIIEGGYRLEGNVNVSGSKNAALGVIAAAMLLDGPLVLENVPQIADINVLLEICEELGASFSWEDENRLRLDPTTINTYTAVGEKTRSIRASYYLQGALIGRLRKAVLAFPGAVISELVQLICI